MKTILLAINSKYIHTNLAVRLLKANTTYSVDFREFTIKDSIEAIVEFVVDQEYDLVGISTYIWNVEYVKSLIPALKEKLPNIKILLGGPEVSYNVDYFLDNFDVDFIIRNEGEEAFDMLLDCLIHNKSLTNVPNLAYKGHKSPLKEVDLKQLKSPFTIENDLSNRITYIETSRGCPFECAYCMASLEKNVRFFNIDTVKQDLLDLMKRGAKVFKFLDRTFNTNIKKSLDLFDFIIANHAPNTSFQFEITGDILPTRVIEHLNRHAPKNLFRFEIGIQSTNDYTNRLVNRIQNKEKLFENIQLIQDANIIDLHLDLIAGLPKEDLTSFEQTFNEVLALRPKELQLGFLKMLRGTALFNQMETYNYKYSSDAPYEIIENDSLSREDLTKIRIVENVLEKYYNSGYLPNAITMILNRIESPFAFFLEFGTWFENQYSWFNYNLDDLFSRLSTYLINSNFKDYPLICFHLKYDYLNYFSLRPKIWWNRLSKKESNEHVSILDQHKLTPYSLEDLYRYCFIEPFENQLLVAIYKNKEKWVTILTNKTPSQS